MKEDKEKGYEEYTEFSPFKMLKILVDFILDNQKFTNSTCIYHMSSFIITLDKDIVIKKKKTLNHK